MPQTANERLQDLTIAHATYLERYKRDQVRRIVALLNDELEPAVVAKLEARLERIARRGFDVGMHTTAALVNLKAAIDAEIHAFTATAQKMLRAELLQVAKAEAVWQVKTLEKVVPKEVALAARIDFTLPAPQTLKAIVDDGPINGALLKDWFKNMEDSAKRAVTKAVNVGLASGETTAQIVSRVRGTKALGYADGAMQGTRAQVRTAVNQAVSHVQSVASAQAAEANKDILKGEKWSATLDTSTCFPASTPVLTPDGEAHIESLSPGSMVVTHRGRARMVTALVRRSYTGPMVTLTVGGRQLAATADHQILLACGVWQEAGDLRPGQRVAGIGTHLGQERREPVAVFPFERLGLDSDHDVAGRAHASVSAPVPVDTLRVPVGAVDLQSDAAGEHEVHKVAANLDFALMFHSERFQGEPDVAFGRGLPLAATVAAPRAMPARLSLSRAHTEGAGARRAGNGGCRAPASLGAMPAPARPVPKEHRSASLAGYVDGFGPNAISRAVYVPPGVRRWDGERLAAGRADLCDPGVHGDNSAFAAAIHLGPQLAGLVPPSASLAGDLGERQTPCMPTHSEEGTITQISVEYTQDVEVYCLQVEEDSSFVAGGVVAHNCPVCAKLDGQIFPVGEGPPARSIHVGCRCPRIPVLKSWEEMGIKGPKLPAGARASMDGQVPGDLTFGEWLKKQPASRVADVLGSKAAAESFLSGETPLSAFSTSMGRPLSWSQVQKRSA
jgi:hypothetical protein